MKKQFETKEALEKWVESRFPEPDIEWTFENVSELFRNPPSQADIAAKLIEEGYDLDDLTANREAYLINGHTNNG